MKYKLLCVSALFVFLGILYVFAGTVNAHQPKIVEGAEIYVTDPEISKAYYGTLSGQPHVYTFESNRPFQLYIGILIPYVQDSYKDVSADIYKNGSLLTTIGGIQADWKPIFEPFGQSKYWDGGEYKILAEAGRYQIFVKSPNNDRRYSLAVGEKEVFNRNEGLNALKLIPDLKRNFFNESPIGFIKSPFGWGYILFMYIVSFMASFMYRLLFIKLAKGKTRKMSKNLGLKDRLLRLFIGIGLLFWAITTSWSPILLFFSGLTIFESVFSWCVFYAAIGKNTCPT